MRRRPPRHARRALRILSLLTALLFLGTSVALAWNLSSTNPGNTVTASNLGSAGTPGVTVLVGSCTSILVSWSAAPGADRYRVESSTAGTWTTLAASHTTTSFPDDRVLDNVTVTYRITPLLAGTSWEGPATTANVTCGVGTVSDLVASHGCVDSTLSWSPALNATRYEVWVSVNGAAPAALTTNLATTTYTDTATYPAGATLDYQVRPRAAGTIGNYSNTATVTGWDVFRVASVAFVGAGGTPVALDAGDQVVVTFTKPVQAGTVTQSTIVASNAGGTRGLFLAASAAGDGTTDLGSFGTPNNFVNTSGTFAGTVGWNATRTVWTWTATASQANVMDGPVSTGWALGTSAARARCAGDGTTALTASAPAVSGSW